MQTYTFTDADLITTANQIRELLITELFNAGEITSEQYYKILYNYTIVVAQKNWLGKAWDKIRGREEGGAAFVVLKSIETYSEKDEDK